MSIDTIVKCIENKITWYEKQIEMAREEGRDSIYWEGCRDSLRILLNQIKVVKE